MSSPTAPETTPRPPAWRTVAPDTRDQMIEWYVAAVEEEVPDLSHVDRFQIRGNATALADHVLAARNA
jgi:hypothetical protein